MSKKVSGDVRLITRYFDASFKRKIQEVLKQAAICTSENYTAVIKHPSWIGMGYVLNVMQQSNLLSQKSFDILMDIPVELSKLSKVLDLLQHVNALDKYAFKELMLHPDLAAVAKVVKLLAHNDLLDAVSFCVVIKHEDLTRLSKELHEFQKLDFDVWKSLISPSDQFVAFDDIDPLQLESVKPTPIVQKNSTFKEYQRESSTHHCVDMFGLGC